MMHKCNGKIKEMKEMKRMNEMKKLQVRTNQTYNMKCITHKV